MRPVYSLLLTLLVLLVLPLYAGAADQRQYLFAVLPQRPPVAMHTAWRPFLDQLEQETGLKFKLKLYETMNQFEDDLKQGTPDFIFATPFQIMMIHHRQNYLPLVRSNRTIAGMLITRKDSAFKKLADLDNQEIAYVGSRNVCSLSLRYILYKQHIKLHMRELFIGSNSNVYKNVLLGKSAAGAILDVDFDAQPPDVKDKLRVMLTAPRIASHPIAVHPRVPKQVQHAVTAAVLKMALQPETNALLQKVQLRDPIRADYARDYKPLEKMDYDALTKGI